MTWFLWVNIVMLVLTVVGKLVWLSSGYLPSRRRDHEAADVAINAALIVWAAVLLSQGGAA